MQGTDHGLIGIGAHLGERVLDAFPGCSELAERIADPDAPVRAGDELAVGSVFGGVSRQAGLMQAERELDDVGNAVLDAPALLIRERLGIAARRQEPLLEMILANDAEMLRIDRLAVLAQRSEQLGDADAVDLLDAVELR